MDHLLSMEKDKTVSLATCMFCLVLRDYSLKKLVL